MKRLAYLLAGLGGVMATQPASAASGFVGASYDKLEVDTGFGSGSADGYSIEGAVAFSGADLGVEVDAGHRSLDGVDGNGALLHLYNGNGGARFGGFLGFSESDGDTSSIVGLEGLLYRKAITFGGSVAYVDGDGSNGVTIDGEARFFFNDHLRLDGHIGYADSDSDSAYMIGAGGEVQLHSAPVSLFAGYRHIEFNDTNASGDQFRIGAHFTFGGTLRQRDHDGPGFAGLAGLAGFGGDA